MTSRWVVSLAVLIGAMVVACTSEVSGTGGSSSGVPGFTRCHRDVDCPSGYVCDEDDPNDSYCTPGCTTNEDCPVQKTCPSLSSLQPSCQVQLQLEAKERGVCDQFQGYNGPNSCRAASASPPSSSPQCTSDSQCSSKCSGSCYGCRSGSCKCGYRGVSGGCIF